MTDFDDSLETPKQLAARVGLKDRQIRRLIAIGQLESVQVGCRKYIPRSAWPRFLSKAEMVKPCQDETKAPSSVGSPSAVAITLPGQRGAGAASAALARQTARKLKQSSGNGSTLEDAETARVIPLKYS